MSKDELIEIFRGQDWCVAYNNIYLCSKYHEQNFHICFEGVTEHQLDDFDDDKLKNLISKIENSDIEAHKIIHATSPYSNTSELKIHEIVIYLDSSFALGYNAGEYDSGKLFIYVKFDNEFKPYPKLFYEMY